MISEVVLKIRDRDSIVNFSLIYVNIYVNINLSILCSSPKFVLLNLPNSTHSMCAYEEIISSPVPQLPFSISGSFNLIILKFSHRKMLSGLID